MKLVMSSAVLLAGLLGAQAASAGGYTPVVVEPTVGAVSPVAEVTSGEWQGAYGGVTLGYAFNGDDRVGVKRGDTLVIRDLGNADIHGINGGVRVGYRWQRNRLVIGPELSIEGGNVDDEFTTDDGLKVESKLRSKVALKLKTGYEVQPNTLAYGIAGVTRGSFDYKIGDLKEEYDASGYVFGLGVERKVTDRMSVTGEIEHSTYHDKDVEFSNGLSTDATPEHTNVKLGLNFKF